MGRKLSAIGLYSLVITYAFLSTSLSIAATEVEYAHPGYVDDVKEERLHVAREIVIVPYNPTVNQNVMDQIVTEKMTKEFSREFRRQFGYTEFEQLQMTSNRMVESMDSGRQLQFEDYLNKQEKFGQYMAKELTEYHVDKYLRGNRSTRQIYEVKEKISNIQVEAKGGYKVKIRYKLTTNRVNFKVEKPGEKFHKSMDSKLDGSETMLKFAYDVNRTIVVGSDINVEDQIYATYAAKKLSPLLSVSITGQSYTKDLNVDTPKQDRVLLGLSWSD